MTREIVARQLGDTTAAEEALARAHEFLAETLRAKAELMAQMGHEIRTPLNGIVGTTELLMATPLSDEQREYATATMTSATALMVVINDVLDFSMLEAGTLELDAGAFEVRHVLDGIALALPAGPQTTGVKIATEVADGVPPVVSGDGNRIRHVLTKLVGSALRQVGEGDLTVRLSATKHAAKRAMLRFEVSDRDGRLASDSLEALFELRAHANGARAQNERVTGIGLTVCRQLVELMGGEIGVEHGAPGGAVVWFTTPVGIDGAIPYPQERIRQTHAPEPPSEPAPATARTRRGGAARRGAGSGGQRVLIADDDPVSQLVLTRQLEARGYVVDVTANGREALALYKPGGYDAVFMDCQMPELNGFEATAAIREQELEAGHTPIIGMTASAREADREQCYVSGMDDYVAKPLDQVTLDAALARRLPKYDDDAKPAKGRRRGAEAPVPLLENSLLTDVFRHNSESRGYLIGVFIEESRARIAQLAAAGIAGDSATMQRLAHALKGSARTVGARRMEQVCESVQEPANEGRVGEATRLQATLERCFEQTAELLRRGCPESGVSR
ncbi:MAG TPA: response regulator [Solirubrobacteraceae bacterium]|nr:response regulator [Solirubrobacteraceae bacterium]